MGSLRWPLAALTAALGISLAGPSATAADGEPLVFDHALYGELLERYTVVTDDVAGTRVDYRGLSRSAGWRKLLAQLSRSRPERLSSGDSRMAFWINAYNILAIQTVIDHYPVESIRDVGSFFSPVWKREAGRIGTRSVTLHEIEHEILRPMGDPRIHGAIVCASTSCPSLARTPFRSDSLGRDLDASMRRWLSNREKGVAIDRPSRTVTVSKIFDWFEGDFGEAGVLAAIAPFLDAEDAAWLRREGADADLEYFDYDWTLNDTIAGSEPTRSGAPAQSPRRVASRSRHD